MAVTFYYLDRKPIPLASKRQVQKFIKDIFRREHRTINQLKYIFASDEYVLDLNKKFLDHDYFTDILTFDLSTSDEVIIGEIYISTDRVVENALTEGVSLEEEYLRVIFHGALHLCGFSDELQKDKVEMRNMEDEYLKLYKAVNVSRETLEK